MQAEIDLKRIESFLEQYEDRDRSSLIPILQETQKIYGYLPRTVIERIAEYLDLPLSRIYGVITFYAQFHLTPHGRNTIRVCRGTACHVRGEKEVLNAVEEQLGIKDGETTEDLEFSIETVACLGTCFLAPIMMINDSYFGKLTPKKVKRILTDYRSEV